MIIDCHVHACTATPGHGHLSEQLLKQWNVRFMRWRLGINAADGATLERQAEDKLLGTINGADKLDAAVVLALDAVYTRDGNLDEANTHLHVTNEYVAELASRQPKVLFGASIHPYRPDAVAELERCVQRARGVAQVAASRAKLQSGRRALLAVLQGAGPSSPAVALSHRRRKHVAQPQQRGRRSAIADSRTPARRHGNRRPLRHTRSTQPPRLHAGLRSPGASNTSASTATPRR